jgi:hypothetical protein
MYLPEQQPYLYVVALFVNTFNSASKFAIICDQLKIIQRHKKGKLYPHAYFE